MTDRTPQQPSPATTTPPRGAIVLTAGEFFWLTLAVWIGGVFILTLMPVLLIPRLGMPLGVVASYLVFFLAWQPIQTITQRTFGMRAGIIRMVLFVARRRDRVLLARGAAGNGAWLGGHRR